ncbi:DUF523 domain-containing protein [Natranaerofaba carboxydovora]|uniref:DUF523 domain-containing protein n=1 Tax=Natranaerofaba carboxydovora TaxID=2742683 RepID=UPI001F1484EA|nr:DUF523 domain-containing protein [Natranaerofaba carboxydovora]UMZ75233.1 hypothetical protein ACONDI_02852 [Natranaerofaba carboxydovora]
MEAATIILVSACLIGIDCNYKGENNLESWVLDLCNSYLVIPVCPEQLGGLTTPRLPSELKEGDGESIWEGKKGCVINSKGEEFTQQFIFGAKQIIKISRIFGIRHAIMKDKSPSCGVFNIFDGSFSGNIIEGMGVTVAGLYYEGINIFSQKQKEEFSRMFLY